MDPIDAPGLLSHTELTVTISDLVAEFALLHRFRNERPEPVEAVFTFPVPLDAAFLGMRANLAGQEQVAVLQPREAATRQYDSAIAEGNSAVLLRNPEPGLLSLSLGNLLPGETGEIALRFAVPVAVADSVARFNLPLVHRPRYGQWHADIECLDRPAHDFLAEHPMSATIRIEGLLAEAAVSCSLPGVRFARERQATVIRIEHALLDRDLLLRFELPAALAPRAQLIEDQGQAIGLVSFLMPVDASCSEPLDICLLLDGSGSMTGDAIAQSREAMVRLVRSLTDADRIQVLRFGSETRPLFRRLLPASARVRDSIDLLASSIDADLGGTEMGDALMAALGQFGAPQAGRRQVIVLVTDGAVQPDHIANAERAAAAQGVRVFVVAVGSSAGVEVLEPLATATRGVLERAVAMEPIDDCVLRLLRRARQPGPVELQVAWPDGAVPLPMARAYGGDVVQVVAQLPPDARGEVQILVKGSGYTLAVELPRVHPDAAQRALIGRRLHLQAEPAQRAGIAMQYGLLTRETAALLVRELSDEHKPAGLPTLVCVPQMLPHGMLSVASPRVGYAMRRDPGGSDVCFDIPAFMRRESPPPSECPKPRREPAAPVVEAALARLYAVYRDWMDTGASPPPLLDAAIAELPEDARDEVAAVIAWLDLSPGSAADAASLLLVLCERFGDDSLSDGAELALAVVHAAADPGVVSSLRRAIRWNASSHQPACTGS